MNRHLPERPHILFLFSDTGGGHRSATEAMIEAIQLEYGESISTEMVDFFKDYAPAPFDKMPAWYPHMVRIPQAWGLGFHLSDGHRRARLLTSTFWPYVRRATRDLVKNHPCDLIVSAHPLANAPVLRALGTNRPPFITVVTDLVTTHALWYHRLVDLCIVPTEPARQRALSCGLRENQLQVVGLPVADRFCRPIGDPAMIRARLGWPEQLPVILLMGGGDGLGPIGRTARAINAAHLPAALVVVTGRNKSLKAELESLSWNQPTFIYGFVHEMPDYMRAADVLVTKAGPGTISEAFNAGLPLIIYSRLPGQEDGNVQYVRSENAGVWAPTTDKIVTALQNWIYNKEERKKAAEACRRLARPHAAKDIAQILAQNVGIKA